jgi:hypothetical protein
MDNEKAEQLLMKHTRYAYFHWIITLLLMGLANSTDDTEYGAIWRLPRPV